MISSGWKIASPNVLLKVFLNQIPFYSCEVEAPFHYIGLKMDIPLDCCFYYYIG